jgi:uroporphyrin-III C-methyltransferase
MGGTLYIVGGDPDLITVKASRVLRQADVVLYDALVSAELLEVAKPHFKLISVGKRKGSMEFSQEEINQLLVFYVSRLPCVVRLKGGDPYVFGRGHEELA